VAVIIVRPPSAPQEVIWIERIYTRDVNGSLRQWTSLEALRAAYPDVEFK
jgi:hypothetical protein